MSVVEKRSKALSESPLKASQPVGASLAFLGIEGALPLMHGSQGCTAFAKVYFVRHYREPIPLQTTAMDQVSAVMGADDSIVEALVTMCKSSSPKFIGLTSTGLSEMQGCNLGSAVKKFRQEHPEFEETRVVWVNTPDFKGCFETGYAAALRATIEQLVPLGSPRLPGNSTTINILAGSFLTPGDVEELEDIVERFGLRARIVPDVSRALGGELHDEDFSAVTTGGVQVEDLEALGDARATIVIGPSLFAAGDILEKRTGVPLVRLNHVHTLTAVDELISALFRFSDCKKVPERIEKNRRQLQDTMLDTHFSLGMRRWGVAGDADLLLAFSDLIHAMGGEVVAAVTPAKAPALNFCEIAKIKIGDLGDLAQLAKEGSAEILLSNSHCIITAKRLKLPLIQAGFPQYELIGGYHRRWIGYRGIRDTLFDFARTGHALASGEIEPYQSVLRQASA